MTCEMLLLPFLQKQGFSFSINPQDGEEKGKSRFSPDFGYNGM